MKSLVDRLAETVGDAKAREAVGAAAKRLGLQSAEALDQAQTLQVLSLIASQEDVTGIAARLLRIRADFAFDKFVAQR